MHGLRFLVDCNSLGASKLWAPNLTKIVVTFPQAQTTQIVDQDEATVGLSPMFGQNSGLLIPVLSSKNKESFRCMTNHMTTTQRTGPM